VAVRRELLQLRERARVPQGLSGVATQEGEAGMTNRAGHDGSLSEKWIPVRGYEGLYEVSDLGRIRSVNRTVNGAYPYMRKGAMLHPSTKKNGYQHVLLYRNGNRKDVLVHRVVMESFVGPSDLQVNHINEDKSDNRLTNLEYMTASENTRYSKARPIEQFDLVTGKTIKTYPAEYDVKKDGFDVGAVNNCCLQKPRYLSHQGFGWRFVNG